VTTVADLQRAVFPSAHPVAAADRPASPPDAPGARRTDREVAWVRVLRSRVPAFEALESTDLAIIPGPSLALVAPADGQIEAVAQALDQAGVPAVLLIDGDVGRESLRRLADTLAGAGLTTLWLDEGDPLALERSVIAYLVNQRAELDRRAAELETQLARFALHGRGLDDQAAAIAAFLGRAVVIEGRRGDPIAMHAPADQPLAAAAVSRYLARPSAIGPFRVDLPTAGGEPGPGGRLLLLGDDPPTEFERIVAERIAALLALELARDEAVRQARDETRRGDPLPADGPPWVVLLAAQGDPTGAEGDLAAREAVRAQVRLLMSPRRLVLRGSTESLELRLVAAAPADDPLGMATADRLAGVLGRTVALSRPFDERAARPAAEAAARATLDAAVRLPRPPRVARVVRLPAYLLLGNLRNLPDGLTQAQGLLAPILGGRAEVVAERLATLSAVLASPSLAEAADRLGIHRNTVAYRVQRLEARGDWDLADPDLRVALLLAVRVMQNAQTS
jgi:purine catabolism regulator